MLFCCILVAKTYFFASAMERENASFPLYREWFGNQQLLAFPTERVLGFHDSNPFVERSETLRRLTDRKILFVAMDAEVAEPTSMLT
jgi:hypothetical protein